MPLKPLITSEATLTNLTKPAARLAVDAGTTLVWDIPQPLLEFLHGLQHLEDVPFSCLVADPEQLPPESLRFFYVDPSWQRALVEGALSAASAGTADDDERLEGFRATLLNGLNAMSGGATRTVTGMLLRSAVVRYHPKLIVRAKDGAATLTTLRFARLSQNILLVLWQGRPTRVDIEEPRTSAWFGVDREGNTYKIERKDDNGIGVDDGRQPPAPQKDFAVRFRADSGGRQVLDVARLASDIAAQRGAASVTSAEVGLQLQQQPYRQIFEGTSDQGGPTRVDLSELVVQDLLAHVREVMRPHGL